MYKPQIKIPNRPKPYLVEAYNGYYGNLNEFRTIIARFWKSRSPMYSDATLLCSAFPVHISPSASNGFMNEFHIRSLEECYEFSDILDEIESYTRNWKYCEYYIGTETVYHDELYFYIRNILKNVNFPDIKIINPKTELKIRRGKWIHEKLLYNIVVSLYPDYNIIYHYRSKWLDNLELDIYFEDFKIGIEYQGIQHYQVIEHWGGENGLKKRQLNDAKKKQLCEENNVTLIYFDYTEPITNEYVRKKLKKLIKNK